MNLCGVPSVRSSLRRNDFRQLVARKTVEETRARNGGFRPGPCDPEGVLPMQSQSQSEAVIAMAGPTLEGVAVDAGGSDAEAHLDPATPSPTSGELRLRSEGGHAVADLDAAQATDATSADIEIGARQGVIDAHENGEAVHPPVGPAVRPKHFEIVIVCLLGVVEALALRLPVETILNLSSRSFEGVFIAGAVALLAAALSHQFGAHLVSSREVRGRNRDRDIRTAWLFAASVVVIGGVAVCARVYAAGISARINSGRSLSPSGVAFFIGFQLAFVAANLGLATSLQSRISRAAQTHADSWIMVTRNELVALRIRKVNEPTHFALQREKLDAIRRGAVLRYRSELIERHPDLGSSVGWSSRTAREVVGGALFRQVFPDIALSHDHSGPDSFEPDGGRLDRNVVDPPPGADGTGSVALGGDEPPYAEDWPEPREELATEHIDELPPPASADSQPTVDDTYPTDGDLFAAILD